MGKEEDIPLWIPLFEQGRKATSTNMHYPWFHSLPVLSREIKLDVISKFKHLKGLRETKLN